jgi:hypothetical protein
MSFTCEHHDLESDVFAWIETDTRSMKFLYSTFRVILRDITLVALFLVVDRS